MQDHALVPTAGSRGAAGRATLLAAVLGALALIALGLGAPAARAATLLEKNFWLSGPEYSGDVPVCAEPKALELIAKRFAETDEMYWHTGLRVVELDRVNEIAFRPWGPAYLPRRYCSARALTSDNRRRAVYFSIIEDGSFIGWTWGVEWCIMGLDHNFAYAPSCKMARP